MTLRILRHAAIVAAVVLWHGPALAQDASPAAATPSVAPAPAAPVPPATAEPATKPETDRSADKAAPAADKPASAPVPPAAAAQPATPDAGPAAEKSAATPDATPDAAPAATPAAAPNSDTREAMCLMIESAAKAQDLPLEFFARVIWQESRFKSDAVGPVTRNGQRAQGIAQFMPGTANERRLLDPFDPVQALPKSAEYLRELRNQFGNLGLAAAAYNAGPRRVQEWIAGTGYMPAETRNYVAAITGTSVDDWAAAAAKDAIMDSKATSNCRDLIALLTRAPNPFVTTLGQRIKQGADRPWGVQLAAGFSRDRVMAMYARAMHRLSKVIGDQDPSLMSSLLRSRGTRAFYQVRIGTDTRAQADALCGKIERAGQACIALRNLHVRAAQQAKPNNEGATVKTLQ